MFSIAGRAGLEETLTLHNSQFTVCSSEFTIQFSSVTGRSSVSVTILD